MSDAEHKEFLDLLPAYALGILESDEAAAVSQHLSTCAACQGELNAYASVVDLLPLAAPASQPSTVLKERLITQVGSGPASETIDTRIPASPARPERSWTQQIGEAFQNLLAGPRWRPVALLIIIALVVGNVIQWQQVNTPDPNSWRRVRLTGTDLAPEAGGIIYISADGLNGTLIVEGLPQLGFKEQYQLWLIEDGERISGGVFSVDSDGYRGIQIKSAEPLQNYGAFGITIEPAGGSPGPTGERVLGYNL